MKMTKPEDVRTPNPAPEGYDWRREPWLDETIGTDLMHTIAFHIVTALAAEPGEEFDDDQSAEDARVLALLRPDVTERISKGPHADEIVRYRLVQAVAQGIAMITKRWVEMYGSPDAKGMSREDYRKRN